MLRGKKMDHWCFLCLFSMANGKVEKENWWWQELRRMEKFCSCFRYSTFKPRCCNKDFKLGFKCSLSLWASFVSFSDDGRVSSKMQREPLFLEAWRRELYRWLPVPEDWHECYKDGKVNFDQYRIKGWKL